VADIETRLSEIEKVKIISEVISRAPRDTQEAEQIYRKRIQEEEDLRGSMTDESDYISGKQLHDMLMNSIGWFHLDSEFQDFLEHLKVRIEQVGVQLAEVEGLKS